MAVKGLRPLRMARFIQQELGRILLTRAGDPLLQSVVVTHVKMSPDLHEARVFFRTMNDTDPAEVLTALTRAHRYLEKTLGPDLHMPFLPRLTFRYDDQAGRQERLEELFRRVAGEGADVS